MQAILEYVLPYLTPITALRGRLCGFVHFTVEHNMPIHTDNYLSIWSVPVAVIQRWCPCPQAVHSWAPAPVRGADRVQPDKCFAQDWLRSVLLYKTLHFEELQVWFNGLLLLFCLEKSKATNSSILAWRIPQTEEHGRLQSIALQRVIKDWRDLACVCHKFLMISEQSHSFSSFPGPHKFCSKF